MDQLSKTAISKSRLGFKEGSLKIQRIDSNEDKSNFEALNLYSSYPTLQSFQESIKSKSESQRLEAIGIFLEQSYRLYNHRGYIHPDPLEFLYRYQNPLDTEIVALVASCLAYGRVSQILRSVTSVLSIFDRYGGPRRFIEDKDRKEFLRFFSSFKHRFTTCKDLVDLLTNIQGCISKFGSIGECFWNFYDESDYIQGLSRFCNFLGIIKSFFPDPLSSTCKRLHLCLRWMVRKDEVDPGIWYKPDIQSKLWVPLDTHMLHIYNILAFDNLKPSINSVRKITSFFLQFSPSDPIKYDFCLTRYGIQRNRIESDIKSGIITNNII